MIWGSVASLFAFNGESAPFVRIERDRGKALEERFYEAWSGKPSVTTLRHSVRRLDKSSKEHYRCFLTRTVSGLTLLTVDDEQYSASPATPTAKIRVQFAQNRNATIPRRWVSGLMATTIPQSAGLTE